MGAGSALTVLNRSGAALRVQFAALKIARLEMRGAGGSRSSGRRIEIDVEHAVRPGELQLGSLALDNLQPRFPQQLNYFTGRHAIDGPMVTLDGGSGCWRGRLRGRRGGGTWGTGRDEQHGGQDQVTHALLVAGQVGAGKLAGTGKRR